MAKMPSGTKGWIVKLYKAETDINEIQKKVKPKFPKITKTRIRSVVRRHLEDLADDLWSTAVKVKFGWKCAISNKTENLEAHHLIRRGNWTHRYTVDNGIALNSYYHTLGAVISAHGATDVTDRFRDWMKKHHKEQWAWFEQHRDEPSRKPDIEWLLKIVRFLEGEIKNGYHIESENPGARKRAEEVSSSE
jgi:hypothetical protein